MEKNILLTILVAIKSLLIKAQNFESMSQWFGFIMALRNLTSYTQFYSSH
jgi:hypothetical protein